MQTVFQVERDQEGLHMALVALFEEAFQRGAIESAVREGDRDTRLRALESMDERKLSPGYYAQASYLMDLGYSMEAGVQYSATMLTRDDVRGLRTLKNARAEFEREHPCCSGCGTRQDNGFARKCKGCGVSFSRGDN